MRWQRQYKKAVEFKQIYIHKNTSNIKHTNKYNKRLQSPGALNIKETFGYKQKENVKKIIITNK